MLQSPEPADMEMLLKAPFPEGILAVERHYDMTVVTVKLQLLEPVIRFLKESGFAFLTSCHGIHFPKDAQRFGMVYHLHDLPQNRRIRVKAFTNEDPPVFPSLTPLFPSANWMERETYDFFGFRFTGHPNLVRILNMDDMEGWPLRKEYPLEDQARFDKDDKLFGR